MRRCNMWFVYVNLNIHQKEKSITVMMIAQYTLANELVVKKKQIIYMVLMYVYNEPLNHELYKSSCLFIFG
jgi:hypothetical protein